MKIRAKEIDWEGLPDEISDFAKPSQTCVTAGKEYTVLAMSVYERVWFVLICDDYSMAEFLPLHLFDQVTTDIPPEWICTLNPGQDLDMVLGPDFIARDHGAYSSIVDKEVATVDKLWEFYNVLLARERAEVVEPE